MSRIIWNDTHTFHLIMLFHLMEVMSCSVLVTHVNQSLEDTVLSGREILFCHVCLRFLNSKLGWWLDPRYRNRNTEVRYTQLHALWTLYEPFSKNNSFHYYINSFFPLAPFHPHSKRLRLHSNSSGKSPGLPSPVPVKDDWVGLMQITEFPSQNVVPDLSQSQVWPFHRNSPVVCDGDTQNCPSIC